MGPARGPGQLQPQAWHPPGLLQDSWERARLGCVARCLFGLVGLNKSFSKRKRKKRHSVAVWGILCSSHLPPEPPPPQPLDGVHQICSPAAAGAPLEALGSVCIRSTARLQQVPTAEAQGTEHLPPSPCAQSPTGLTGSLGGRRKHLAEGSCRAPGDGSPQKGLTQ